MTSVTPTNVPNFRVIAPGIFRGGQPTGVADWTWLRQQAGVTAVVKLNENGEGSDQPATAMGMKLTYKPIDLCEQLVFRPKYQDVMDAVNALVPGTFVHCTHGEDRTGLVVACYRVWVQGWTKENAEAEMKLHGFHPELLGLTLFWEWAV